LKLVLDTNDFHPATIQNIRSARAVALIAKATEGTSYQAKSFGGQRFAASVARVPFGSYLFLHPDSTGSEAEFYLRFARPRKGDIQPIIDAEVTTLGTDELARRTEACAKALEAEGYKPLLYASAGIWGPMVASQPSLKRLRVWEADYPRRYTRWFPGIARLRIRLRHGVNVVLWQWTDSFAVDGRRFDASNLLVNVKSLLIP
jgi:GH25 family lysozyme M1 (1,4-beta-N-acetylmuramidase)